MNLNDVWNLFKQTGKVAYFIEYRKMLEGKIDTLGDNKNRRHDC